MGRSPLCKLAALSAVLLHLLHSPASVGTVRVSGRSSLNPRTLRSPRISAIWFAIQGRTDKVGFSWTFLGRD